MIEQNVVHFIQTQNQKQLLTRVILMMCLNQLILLTIISNIQKSLGKCWGWTVDSVKDHCINVSKYNPLAGSSYIKLSNEAFYKLPNFEVCIKLPVISNYQKKV